MSFKTSQTNQTSQTRPDFNLSLVMNCDISGNMIPEKHSRLTRSHHYSSFSVISNEYL